MTTAIVIGATGLTGQGLVRHLLQTDRYHHISVFSRRKLELQHPKLKNHVVNFERLQEWQHLIQGDDFFSALGTTRKQAGSKLEQYRVDYTYQANTIQAAADNGAQRLFLVSSPNASLKSPMFYLRMKAELEQFCRQLNFATLAIFQPSVITGERTDTRVAEKIGAQLITSVCKWVPGTHKYRPISGDELGQAIVACACGELSPGEHVFMLEEIFQFLD